MDTSPVPEESHDQRQAWNPLFFAIVASTVAYAQDAVKIAPDNPKYLWFRGKPWY